MPTITKLEPKYDVVFHRLFGEENGCRLLISLLNALLGWPEERRIRQLSILTEKPNSDSAKDKDSCLDVRAIDEEGRQLNIEVQVGYYPYYIRRLLYYWARLHSSQLGRGKPYQDMRPTIGVHILDWKLFGATDQYHHVYELRERRTQHLLSDQQELHFLELPRFKKELNELLSPEEKWLYFLRNGHKLTGEQAARMELPEIAEAESRLAVLSQDDIARLEYEQRFKAEQDRLAEKQDWILYGQEVGHKEGHEKGHKEGECKALVDSIREVWTLRFGPPSEEVLSRLRAVDQPERLRGILSAVLRAPDQAAAEASL